MNKTRNAIIVLGLLGAIAVVNYFGGPQPAGSTSDPEQDATAMDTPMDPPEDEHEISQPALQPFGPDDALVRLEVFYEEDNDCQTGISSDACDLAHKYHPYLQTQLRPWSAEGTEERAEELNAHCLVIIALSDRTEDGEWGPANVEYMGPPNTEDWKWGDLEGLIAARLTKAGVELTPSEILARSAAASDEASEDTAEVAE